MQTPIHNIKNIEERGLSYSGINLYGATPSLSGIIKVAMELDYMSKDIRSFYISENTWVQLTNCGIYSRSLMRMNLLKDSKGTKLLKQGLKRHILMQLVK